LVLIRGWFSMANDAREKLGQTAEGGLSGGKCLYYYTEVSSGGRGEVLRCVKSKRRDEGGVRGEEARKRLWWARLGLC